jgi:flagellar motor switch protein FliM
LNIDARQDDINPGARKLQGAMLGHQPGVAIERMPGLVHALNRFIVEAPERLLSLVPRPTTGSIEEVRATTLFQAIGDCSGLVAAVYASSEPEARLLIALDERIDDLVVASIFGEVVGTDSEQPKADTSGPRTAIEIALVEAFASALGKAFEAALAPLTKIVLSFDRLTTLDDPYALGRRDSEAAAARFLLRMSGGACECLLLLPQALLLPLRKQLARDAEDENPSHDQNWSQLMEVGVRQTRMPVSAILEEVPMSLADVANLRVGELLPLRGNDFTAIRLVCSGREMFTCKLGQGEGRYRLEIIGPITEGREEYAA